MSLTTTKTTHPADGSPRWTVTGPAGTVCYDRLGNHLAILNPSGEVIDSLRKRYALEARKAALVGDDAVFVLLTGHYRTHLDDATVADLGDVTSGRINLPPITVRSEPDPIRRSALRIARRQIGGNR